MDASSIHAACGTPLRCGLHQDKVLFEQVRDLLAGTFDGITVRATGLDADAMTEEDQHEPCLVLVVPQRAGDVRGVTLFVDQDGFFEWNGVFTGLATSISMHQMARMDGLDLPYPVPWVDGHYIFPTSVPELAVELREVLFGALRWNPSSTRRA